MAKGKYKFDPESLSFNKIQFSIKAKIFRFFSYFLATLLIAIAYNVFFFSFFNSPKEKALNREISQLILQYEIAQKKLELIENELEFLQKTDDNIYRTIFEAEPIPNSRRESGIGGVNRYADLEGFGNSEIVIETSKRLDKIKKKLYVQTKSFDEIIELAKNKEDMLASVPAIQPISNKDLRRTASGWGYRIHPVYKIRKFHFGMDFTAPTGTEIYATGNGKVVEVKQTRRGFGKTILIDHGYGHKTRYAHLSKFTVKKRQKVNRGDVIGYVGSTGTSTAPHLHYEVIQNGKKVNPVNYFFNDLSDEEYDRMIVLSMKSGQSFD
ncbi:MAG: peptidoglycan DD-metalloendopeptidase family protein [Bacteroidetes bacterium]|nr:peptidoglycan DD-metalloendopeptidase family protein [Bacteroidota bacterium]